MKKLLHILTTSAMCVASLSAMACAYNTLQPCGPNPLTLQYTWSENRQSCTDYCNAGPGQIIQVAGGASSGLTSGTPTYLICAQSCTVTCTCVYWLGDQEVVTSSIQEPASYASGSQCPG